MELPEPPGSHGDGHSAGDDGQDGDGDKLSKMLSILNSRAEHRALKQGNVEKGKEQEIRRQHEQETGKRRQREEVRRQGEKVGGHGDGEEVRRQREKVRRQGEEVGRQDQDLEFRGDSRGGRRGEYVGDEVWENVDSSDEENMTTPRIEMIAESVKNSVLAYRPLTMLHHAEKMPGFNRSFEKFLFQRITRAF